MPSDRTTEALIRSLVTDNEHERASANKRFLEHVHGHLNGQLWAWIETRGASSQALQDLQNQFNSLMFDYMILKSENSRLKSQNRVLKKNLPPEAKLRTYSNRIKEWFSQHLQRSEDSWISTEELQLRFESTHRDLPSIKTSRKQFSIYFSKISRLTSVKGGARKERMGFRVRLVD